VAAAGWEIVVTHGNGPQVGRILLQQEAARGVVHPMPLDVCGPRARARSGTCSRSPSATSSTSAGPSDRGHRADVHRVRADDPAFQEPTKPIGPYYEELQPNSCPPSTGGTWPPTPRRVPAGRSVARSVLDRGGAGDHATRRRRRHRHRLRWWWRSGAGRRTESRGRRSVVDKDLAGAILARDVGAKVLLDLTDVGGCSALGNRRTGTHPRD